MTAADLKKSIESGRLSDDIEQHKWFNYGLEYALGMVDVFIDWQEPEAGEKWKEIMNHVDSV